MDIVQLDDEKSNISDMENETGERERRKNLRTNEEIHPCHSNQLQETSGNCPRFGYRLCSSVSQFRHARIANGHHHFLFENLSFTTRPHRARAAKQGQLVTPFPRAPAQCRFTPTLSSASF